MLTSPQEVFYIHQCFEVLCLCVVFVFMVMDCAVKRNINLNVQHYSSTSI